MTKIFIVGGGQIGSRHLQGLKGVKQPLNIKVIDPSEGSLKTAKERFDGILPENNQHKVEYLTSIPEKEEEIDIALITTGSNVRRIVVEEICQKHKIKSLILEKILFQRKEDYQDIQALLREKGIVAWVNCAMRVMPSYEKIRKIFPKGNLIYHISGSNVGLVTNAIHYVDHVAHLTGCNDFKINMDLLDKKPIESKRKGFLELLGTLRAEFSDGSIAIMTDYGQGDTPVTINISNEKLRYISRESEGKGWLSTAEEGWVWQEVDAPIPYQSQSTTLVVEDLLESGKCNLVNYEDSIHVHLQLLEPLKDFLNEISEEKYDVYPFT